MKKKLIMLLCAGMLLGGCGVQSVRDREEYDGKTYDEGTCDTDGREESEKVEESRETNPVESEETKTGEAGEGEVKKLGSGSGRQITPVTLENAWQRAAFLADQVFAQQGGNVLVSPMSLESRRGLTFFRIPHIILFVRRTGKTPGSSGERESASSAGSALGRIQAVPPGAARQNAVNRQYAPPSAPR